MKQLFLILITFTVLNNFGQQYSCDGNRFKNYTFSNVDSTINILYGQNTTLNGITQNLYLDVFEPSFDTAIIRPLIILIHGGGFMVGNRNEMKALCLDFSLRGYVTATIDYRLLDIFVNDSLIVTEGMIMAMGDAKASIRYFVEDAATTNTFKIDTNNIFIAGMSAGGITSLQVAYLDPSDNIPNYITNIMNNHGGFTGNSSNNTSYSTPIKAVANYSGALWRKEWISSGEPALFSVHDSYDTIVPCNYDLSKAFPNPFPIYFYGSCVINPIANIKGIYNQIHTINSSGHVSYLYSPTLYPVIIQETADFFYNTLCNNALSIENNSPNHSIKIYPNPSSDYFTIETIGINFPQKFNLYDSQGKKIISTQLLKDKNVINTKKIPEGVYFYTLSSKDFTTSNKVLINK